MTVLFSMHQMKTFKNTLYLKKIEMLLSASETFYRIVIHVCNMLFKYGSIFMFTI